MSARARVARAPVLRWRCSAGTPDLQLRLSSATSPTIERQLLRPAEIKRSESANGVAALAAGGTTCSISHQRPKCPIAAGILGGGAVITVCGDSGLDCTAAELRFGAEDAPLPRHTTQLALARWVKRNSGPATRSFTVLETRTSLASARAATRAPMCTAMPPTLSPMVSHSPQCRPQRTSSPRDRIELTTDWAQRTARAGPSKRARKPSPLSGNFATTPARNFLPNERVVAVEEIVPVPT